MSEQQIQSPGRVLIVGAGPTGLGAAYRLRQLGLTDFALCEASDNVGGLARSYTDDVGFTWDVGGHVLFSHYAEYDRVVVNCEFDGALKALCELLDGRDGGVESDEIDFDSLVSVDETVKLAP